MTDLHPSGLTRQTHPTFSVVTPSFNMLAHLRRCHLSVADQTDVAVEHIVVDGGSTDGTPSWLRSHGDIPSLIEPDRGMYDALNKGYRRARGAFVSHLNCDEQYLPGTLATVQKAFAERPDADLVFGDMLVVQPDGTLLCYRKAMKPRWPFILASHLYTFTCTMFLRRRVIEDGFLLNEDFRYAGDAEFVVRLLRAGYRAMHVPRYLAVFAVTGSNMGYTPAAAQELDALLAAAPRWVRALRTPLNLMRLGEKAIHGAFHETFPLCYDIYVGDAETQRHSFAPASGTFRWVTT